MDKHLIVIQGPTASGKTALAIALAKKINTVVISADSRQFYKEVAIGTAKPSLEEQAGIQHYFIDSHSIHDSITVADYVSQALEILSDLFSKFNQVILVGGSGLYIDALCEGLDDIPTDKSIREQIQNQYQLDGLNSLLKELREVDIDYFHKVDQANPLRIFRAIEVYRLTGKPYSFYLLNSNKPKRDFTPIRFVINLDRPILYDRINKRVDLMMSAGLEDEVRSVNVYRHLQSLQTVGYSELFKYFENELTLEEAIELIKRNTRRYAKRQLTWFRRNTEAIWLDSGILENQLNEVLSELAKR
jgi:tRNA dimethylallyltransferase